MAKDESTRISMRDLSVHPADSLVNSCFGGQDYKPTDPSMIANCVRPVDIRDRGLMIVANEKAVMRIVAALRGSGEGEMAAALQLALDVPFVSGDRMADQIKRGQVM